MTAADLERALAALGHTQTSLGAELDLGARTIRRYVSGTVPIPRVVELAIAHLLERHARAEAGRARARR